LRALNLTLLLSKPQDPGTGRDKGMNLSADERIILKYILGK
jgi:hypothetical protein